MRSATHCEGAKMPPANSAMGQKKPEVPMTMSSTLGIPKISLELCLIILMFEDIKVALCEVELNTLYNVLYIQ